MKIQMDPQNRGISGRNEYVTICNVQIFISASEIWVVYIKHDCHYPLLSILTVAVEQHN